MAPAAFSSNQQRSWSEVLTCPLCGENFSPQCIPVSLNCGHLLCNSCLERPNARCSCCSTPVTSDVKDYPINTPILAVLGIKNDSRLGQKSLKSKFPRNSKEFSIYSKIESILLAYAEYLQIAESENGTYIFSESISATLQKKIIALLSVQVALPDGRTQASRILRSIAERIMTEIILTQSPAHISSSLWSAVRSRGCQFLGPAMQEDVLRLVLLALSKGELIARKTLVMYVVQTLSEDYPHVSKTAVGHVVQLLYRASCFNVIKREGESSLMQLKEEFRDYDSLRYEHDSQIVSIATEAGLRISPEQWSSLLYGDTTRRSHMQSCIDKIWAANSEQIYSNAINELKNMHNRSGDESVRCIIEHLRPLDIVEGYVSEEKLMGFLEATKSITDSYIRYIRSRKAGGNAHDKNSRRMQMVSNSGYVGQRLYKTRICREVASGNICSQGDRCSYAHGPEELRSVPPARENTSSVMPTQSQEIPPMVPSVLPPVVHPLNASPITIPEPAFPNLFPFQGLCDDSCVSNLIEQSPAVVPVVLAPTQPSMIMMPQPVPINPISISRPPSILSCTANQVLYPMPVVAQPLPPSNILQQPIMPPPLLPDPMHNPVNVPPAIWRHPDEKLQADCVINGNQRYSADTFDKSPYAPTDFSSKSSNGYVLWGEHGGQDEHHLLLRRNEIISRLVQMRPGSFIDDITDDELESHVSYTVASSVLSETTKESNLVSTNIELPPLPFGHTPMGQFPQMGSICQDNTMTNICSTIRTVGPNTYGEATAPATVQADCSVMNIKDVLDQPLVTPTIQQQNLAPQASFDMVNPSHLMEQLPTTIKPLQLTPTDPQDFVAISIKHRNEAPGVGGTCSC
ncbi:zinc finger c-x8-C-x5-C-x3-H type (and similar) domain-containing protein [Ditylenchus destructor]|uniref:RING-type E3 ubiquitin transferase n=1 Tax=Ditylenchus destructor TaxID=166010 RepID=A0AAD4NLH6_9BILA|nr:zinc finger c-x8-C-x5-C-x3-H type (and similar) domain-containing protein [Ditylenchus destructor]